MFLITLLEIGAASFALLAALVASFSASFSTPLLIVAFILPKGCF